MSAGAHGGHKRALNPRAGVVGSCGVGSRELHPLEEWYMVLSPGAMSRAPVQVFLNLGAGLDQGCLGCCMKRQRHPSDRGAFQTSLHVHSQVPLCTRWNVGVGT